MQLKETICNVKISGVDFKTSNFIEKCSSDVASELIALFKSKLNNWQQCVQQTLNKNCEYENATNEMNNNFRLEKQQ